jgi:hypothetical protein
MQTKGAAFSQLLAEIKRVGTLRAHRRSLQGIHGERANVWYSGGECKRSTGAMHTDLGCIAEEQKLYGKVSDSSQ